MNLNKIVGLFFVSAIAIIVTGCQTPGMTFRGPVQDGGVHDFSPLAENWGLSYNEWVLKKNGRDAQRADMAYSLAARIGEQFGNLKRKLMSEGLSETQANYVIRKHYLEKLDPELRRIVAIQMGYTGYGQTGGAYFPPTTGTQFYNNAAAAGGRQSNMRVGTTPHGMDVIQP